MFNCFFSLFVCYVCVCGGPILGSFNMYRLLPGLFLLLKDPKGFRWWCSFIGLEELFCSSNVVVSQRLLICPRAVGWFFAPPRDLTTWFHLYVFLFIHSALTVTYTRHKDG
jgi:hypothetical protein